MPDLPAAVDVAALGEACPVIDPAAFDTALSGSPFRFADFQAGERIDHVDGMTVEAVSYTHLLAPLTFASYGYENFHLLMPLYVCRRWEGTPRSAEGQAIRWVKPQALRDYPMPPADEPLIPHLLALV